MVIPLQTFEKKGYHVDVASIAGGKVPIDPLSIDYPYNRLTPIRRFLSNGALPCLTPPRLPAHTHN